MTTKWKNFNQITQIIRNFVSTNAHTKTRNEVKRAGTNWNHVELAGTS